MSDYMSVNVQTILLIIVAVFSPIVGVWCLNSLAEIGGSSFYIEHNLWNYYVSFVALVLLGLIK